LDFSFQFFLFGSTEQKRAKVTTVKIHLQIWPLHVHKPPDLAKIKIYLKCNLLLNQLNNYVSDNRSMNLICSGVTELSTHRWVQQEDLITSHWYFSFLKVAAPLLH